MATTGEKTPDKTSPGSPCPGTQKQKKEPKIANWKKTHTHTKKTKLDNDDNDNNQSAHWLNLKEDQPNQQKIVFRYILFFFICL